jgi:hypothetical protein
MEVWFSNCIPCSIHILPFSLPFSLSFSLLQLLFLLFLSSSFFFFVGSIPIIMSQNCTPTKNSPGMDGFTFAFL